MWRRLVAFCRHCVKRTETHWMPVCVYLQKASIRMTVIKAPLLLLFFLGDFLLSFVFGAKYIEKVRPVNKPHHPALFLFFLSISVFASFAFLRIHTPSPLNQEGACVSECVLQGPGVPELSSSLRILSLTSSSHCCRIWTASSMEQLSRRMLSMAKSLSPNSRVPVLDKRTGICTFQSCILCWKCSYTHPCLIILLTFHSLLFLQELNRDVCTPPAKMNLNNKTVSNNNNKKKKMDVLEKAKCILWGSLKTSYLFLTYLDQKMK